MSKIDDLSKNVDRHVGLLSKAITRKAYSHFGLDNIAAAIDAYRAEVAKEIEGLKADVKSAEAAYEREKVRADGLAQEQDRWTNEQLPGWRKRVTEAERQRDQWKNDHDRVAKEKHQVERALKSMTLSKDEWRADSCASEAKLEKAIMQRDASRRLVESLMTAGTSLNNGVPMYAMDPGAPEGDKTVISFECCGVKHTFSPPKLGNWRHEAECQECGSLTTFTSAN